ncbi:hypothetical protein M080_7484, partial [Bacteroides fragilis str. 3397 T10]
MRLVQTGRKSQSGSSNYKYHEEGTYQKDRNSFHITMFFIFTFAEKQKRFFPGRRKFFGS